MPGTAFLMYHELELPGRELCQSDPGYTRYIVSAANFESQMRHLKSLGYQGVSVGKAIEFSGGMQVAITFDDGCETDLIAAAPILGQMNFGATFYVTAGLLGQRGYLNDLQLRQLHARGFEIGCHSMTHAYLPDLDSAGLEREIIGAKQRLEEIIERKVEHFSCPGGRFDKRVIEAVRRAGYRTMSTSRLHLNSKSADVYALGRFSVMRSTTVNELAKACRGEGFSELHVSQTIRDLAKRVLGNRLYDGIRAKLLGRQTPD